eukprot:SRR837773.14182.p2 GENE.SRR837773.14182~~SRR837773.14182.p2  ORF type:complete len:339 (-),score=116.26 SRR837773.14182:111-1001(-)
MVETLEKEVPIWNVEAREQIVEVPQVFYEERLTEVPQIQVAEVIKQVPVQQIQEVQKHIPKIVETKVIQKMVQKPQTLIQETAVEVPKIMVEEVVMQKASGNIQQRIIQTGIQYQRQVTREEVVQGYKDPVQGPEHEAVVIGTRQFAVQAEQVERSERRVTDSIVSTEQPIVTTVNMAQAMQEPAVPAQPVYYRGAPVITATATATAPAQVQSRVTTAAPVYAARAAPVVTAVAPAQTVIARGAQPVYSQQVMYGAATGGVPMEAVAPGQQSLFDALDRNHDGTLSRAEFEALAGR